MIPIRKITILLFLLTTLLLLLPHRVLAEAGLSSAVRTETYKLNNHLAISLLPGGEGKTGYDDISVYSYKLNPSWNLFTLVCQGAFVRDPKGIEEDFDGGPVYIENNILFNSIEALNVETGQVSKNAGLISGGQKFDATYIRSHYKTLNINNLQALDCFVLSFFAEAEITGGLIILVIIIVVNIVSVIRKRRAKKLTKDKAH